MIGFCKMFHLQASPEDRGHASTQWRPNLYSWVTIVPTRPCVIVGSRRGSTFPRKGPCSFHILNALLHEGLESITMLMSEVWNMWDKDLTASQIKCFISGRKVPDSNINPLTPELNPLAQRCLTRFFTGDFASWTVHFVNICVKNQQMQQLFIQFIMYCSSYMVRALHCHLQVAFLVPSERCLFEDQSIVDGRVVSSDVVCMRTQYAHPQYSIDCSSIEYLSEGTRNSPWRWQCNTETCRTYHT
jgi:hypothetical protein